MLPHWNITSQAQSYDIPPVTLFWQRVNQFLCWTTLYMSSVRQGSFNYHFEIFGLTWPEIEPRSLRHGANALITRLLSWSVPEHAFIELIFHCSDDGDIDVSQLGTKSCVTRFIRKMLSIVSVAILCCQLFVDILKLANRKECFIPGIINING